MIPEPRCSVRRCRWLRGVVQPFGTEEEEHPYCPAFPSGIPDDIAYGDDLHLAVRPGQVGDTVYEMELEQ